ncbi:GNAT family N-acetyltransferase [Actinoplanes sp. NPDC023714]|uniref:GNAT family N-acetyltransferase n=1 Tax=Actinoplanes sp. NPDC023714 TaxID=3154322 RepID=UPI003406357A
MSDIRVRPAGEDDREGVARVLRASWGGTVVVAHGTAYDAALLPALITGTAEAITGVLTYHVGGDAMEIVSIDAVTRRSGVGTALLGAAVGLARRRGLRRVWLITTNDNLDALRFYQRRGLRIVGVSPGAVDEARRIKPGIPETGDYGIPLHDELVLEVQLDDDRVVV